MRVIRDASTNPRQIALDVEPRVSRQEQVQLRTDLLVHKRTANGLDRRHRVEPPHQDRLFIPSGLEIGFGRRDLGVVIPHLRVEGHLALQEHLALQHFVGVGRVIDYERIASNFRSQPLDCRVESRHAGAQLIEIGLGKCRIKGRQRFAALDMVAGHDANFADYRCFERLHHEIGAGCDQLAARRDDLVDMGHR